MNFRLYPKNDTKNLYLIIENNTQISQHVNQKQKNQKSLQGVLLQRNNRHVPISKVTLYLTEFRSFWHTREVGQPAGRFFSEKPRENMNCTGDGYFGQGRVSCCYCCGLVRHFFPIDGRLKDFARRFIVDFFFCKYVQLVVASFKFLVLKCSVLIRLDVEYYNRCFEWVFFL